MPYAAEISRTNPSCFLFMIDQSGSMQDPFGGGEPTIKKADGAADAINKLLQNLVIKCARSEGVWDYFYVGVVGYGATVGSAFVGALAGKELVPLSEIATMPARIEERTKKIPDGAGGLIDQTVKFPIWFDPIANGGTPMCQAMGTAQSILSGWLAQHPDSFPPVVIHITDGESTDGDPSSAAIGIKSLASSDGNVLFFNLHLSSQNATPIVFPDTEVGLADQFAQSLFRISSPLTDLMKKAAQQEYGFAVSDGTRGFAFNSDLVSLITFLDIGTRPNNLR